MKSLLKKLSVSNSIFRGVYTDKILPFEIIEKDKAVVIVNISFKNRKLGHWVTLFINNKTLYFFILMLKNHNFMEKTFLAFANYFKEQLYFP